MILKEPPHSGQPLFPPLWRRGGDLCSTHTKTGSKCIVWWWILQTEPHSLVGSRRGLFPVGRREAGVIETVGAFLMSLGSPLASCSQWPVSGGLQGKDHEVPVPGACHPGGCSLCTCLLWTWFTLMLHAALWVKCPCISSHRNMIPTQ